jgi:hypothetical protein
MPYTKVGPNRYKRKGSRSKRRYTYKQLVAIHFAKQRRRKQGKKGKRA